MASPVLTSLSVGPSARRLAGSGTSLVTGSTSPTHGAETNVSSRPVAAWPKRLVVDGNGSLAFYGLLDGGDADVVSEGCAYVAV